MFHARLCDMRNHKRHIEHLKRYLTKSKWFLSVFFLLFSRVVVRVYRFKINLKNVDFFYCSHPMNVPPFRGIVSVCVCMYARCFIFLSLFDFHDFVSRFMLVFIVSVLYFIYSLRASMLSLLDFDVCLQFYTVAQSRIQLVQKCDLCQLNRTVKSHKQLQVN